MRFAIGIPTYNRFDLLESSLQKYLQDFPNTHIHIVDNGKQNIPDYPNTPITVHRPEKNLGVAASWNFLCREIYQEYEYAMILNDDVYLGYGTDLVNQVIDSHPNKMITSFISWSVFLLPKCFFQYVGHFDEIFYPAYYEDSDYIYRMKLLNVIHAVDKRLNPEIIRISMTYEKDPDFVNNAMQTNKQRYIDKWGNLPLLETYQYPYNLTGTGL